MYKCLNVQNYCERFCWPILQDSILVKSQLIITISTFLLILCHFIVKTSVYLFKWNMSSTHEHMPNSKQFSVTSIFQEQMPTLLQIQQQITWLEVKLCLHFRKLFLFYLHVRCYLGNLSLYFCQLIYDIF